MKFLENPDNMTNTVRYRGTVPSIANRRNTRAAEIAETLFVSTLIHDFHTINLCRSMPA